MAKFELYADNAGEYRWRLRANNHQIIAVSGQGYSKKSDCLHGIYLIGQLSPDAAVTDLTKPGEPVSLTPETPKAEPPGALVKVPHGIVFADMPHQDFELPVYLL